MPLKDLPKTLRKVSTDVIPQVGLELQAEGLRSAFREVVRRSPFASGRYRASHMPSVGRPAFAQLGAGQFFPPPGDDRVDAALRGAELGDPMYLTNDARRPGARDSYAAVLEAGLHTDCRGRRAGSPQAPEGVYAQVAQEIPEILGQVSGEVIGRVLNAHGMRS